MYFHSTSSKKSIVIIIHTVINWQDWNLLRFMTSKTVSACNFDKYFLAFKICFKCINVGLMDNFNSFLVPIINNFNIVLLMSCVCLSDWLNWRRLLVYRSKQTLHWEPELHGLAHTDHDLRLPSSCNYHGNRQLESKLCREAEDYG